MEWWWWRWCVELCNITCCNSCTDNTQIYYLNLSSYRHQPGQAVASFILTRLHTTSYSLLSSRLQTGGQEMVMWRCWVVLETSSRPIFEDTVTGDCWEQAESLPGGPGPAVQSGSRHGGEKTWPVSTTPTWGTTGGPAYWTSSGAGPRRTRRIITTSRPLRGESVLELIVNFSFRVGLSLSRLLSLSSCTAQSYQLYSGHFISELFEFLKNQISMKFIKCSEGMKRIYERKTNKIINFEQNFRRRMKILP